jgi:hypothetical protein
MSNEQRPFPVFPQLSNAIAPSSSLPDDLLSAFNAAVFCADTAYQIYTLLLSLEHGIPQEPTFSQAVQLLGRLREHREHARHAVLQVNHRLTEVRNDIGPLRVGQAANAHWLALEMADWVRDEIWKVADPTEWARSQLGGEHLQQGPSAGMSPEALVRNLPQVWQHLRQVSFPYIGTLPGEIEFEAARAAERSRRHKQPPRADPEGVTAGTGRCPKQAEGGQAREHSADDGSDESGLWLTVTRAARVVECNPGAITRAVDDGELKSNGESGRARRIDALDLVRWKLKRAERPEGAESDEAVKKKVGQHCTD